MRSFGSHRGNSTLRIVIEQAARRRLWAQLGPERPSEADAPPGPDAERFSPSFFTALRRIVEQRFAAVQALPEGALRYFGSPGLQLWGLVAEHALVLALDHEDSPAQIAERARRWCACLMSRTAPGLASPHWGHPVYGARIDPRSGDLDVVWAFAGDWCGVARAEAPPPRTWDAPDHWRVLAEAGA